MHWGRTARRLSLIVLGCLLAGAVGLFGFIWYLRPSVMERTEIYKGVYLTVEELPGFGLFPSKGMIVEVHWNEPGVILRNREFDYVFSPENERSPHYDLRLADIALWKEDSSILMNTTLFGPAGLWNSLPGRPVRSNETLVVDGRPSHTHKHSYLFYWDAERRAHMEGTKPPSEEALAEAVLGIGVQGIPVMNGQSRNRGLDDLDKIHDRTFIGVDSLRSILYLFVFENVTGRYLLQRALEEGIVFGAQLDSGRSSHLLIGDKARGIRSHTGIRNIRPLAGYLTVYAEPIEDPDD